MTDTQTPNLTPEIENTFLEQVKKERESLEKLRDEIRAERTKIETLRAEDILSGRAPQPQETKPIEISPREYAERALRNQI